MTQGAGAVLGLPLMSTGEHRFVFVIRHSRGNDGFGMRLGIADADPSATEAAPSAEHYWGFCPYDGRLHAARGGPAGVAAARRYYSEFVRAAEGGGSSECSSSASRSGP